MRVVAVSGGVDSCVLLDFLAKNLGEDFCVAHFNHGTRPSADADAEFVKSLAKKYARPFVSKKVLLGADASEAVARLARWQFLKAVAAGDEIYTAHHLDDLVESIIINFLRGTGWRGITPFFDPQTRQPFLEESQLVSAADEPVPKMPWGRQEILRYAAKNNLTWRQDPTNFESAYLRNRVRPHVAALHAATRQEIFKIYQNQCSLRREAEELETKILAETIVETQNEIICPRAFFAEADTEVAAELLRTLLLKNAIAATRPQISDLQNAIITYGPGKKFNLPNAKFAKFSKDTFAILKTR